ncbi:MAG: hypothetical protein JXR35_07565, partial [Rhodobacteraceae bacterium]|nr:hypothetical protein [Paracoccaceae bacterium]
KIFAHLGTIVAFIRTRFCTAAMHNISPLNHRSTPRTLFSLNGSKTKMIVQPVESAPTRQSKMRPRIPVLNSR